MKKGEKKIGKWTVKVHKMEGLYPYVRLEDFMKVCKGLEEENKKLKEELGEYKKMFEDQLKEAYIKNTAEFLDKKFPKVNGFIELKDIGEL